MSTHAHVDPAATKTTPPKLPLPGRRGVAQLTSYEQRDLLDAIDKLRRAEIPGRDFSIPQVIVCGDQSTGKSSVLEAISQLRFPVGAQFTTKLPTEVVLRNDSSSSIAPVTLTIIADKSRTPEQKAHLENFAFQVNVDDPNAFTNAVNAAFQYLTLYEPHARLWYDRLHVEISGPTQPNLTLVDLPGLIQNEAQVNPGDMKRIRNLVKRYIAEPKAIILAVVRADNDLANQGITQLVKDHGAANRTMGILTRVDRLITASEDEGAATDLIRDQDPSLSLGLGWHALAKMSDETPPPVTFEDRDEAERRFFTRLPWSGLDRSNLGIATLREKLSLRLFSLITHDLAGFVGQLEDKFEKCRLRHDKLGEARTSPGSQSYHLQRIQRDFQSLVRDALDGRYDRSDFASFFDGSSHRDLRATINRYSGEFAAKIREQGKQYHVFGTPEQRGRELEDSVPELHKPNFYPPYKPNGAVAGHSNISLEAYCRVLATFIDDTRGTNLQGFQASGTVTAIFRQQSVHWGTLSREYIDSCYLAASKFVKCAVMHVAGKYTGDKLMLAFVYQSLTEIETRLGKRLNDLLWPYQKSHPSTQHPSFSAHVNPPDRTQRSESTGESTHSSNGDVGIDADDSWASTALKLNLPNNLVYAADALDTADAYYDLALDTFIDNATILGVEAILLDSIKALFSYNDVAQLAGDRLAEIAAEPPGAQQERDALKHQIDVLNEVIQTCKRYKHTTSSYSNLTQNATDRAVKRRNGPPGGSPAAGKRETYGNSGSSNEKMALAALEASSIPDAGNSVQSKQANPSLGKFLASGPPHAKSRSTSGGCHEPSTLSDSQASTQNPFGGFGSSLSGPTLGHESKAAMPGPSAGGLFGSSTDLTSTSRLSGGSLFGSSPVFDSTAATQKLSGGGIFGSSPVSNSKAPTQKSSVSGLFSSAPIPASAGPTQKSSGSGLFGSAPALNSKTSMWSS